MVNAFDLHIVLDCADPDRIARFWMAALGGYDFPFGPPDGFPTWDAWADANDIPQDQRNTGRTLVDKVRDRPDIFFLQVPEPKAGKNRLHLDIKVASGMEGDERRARIEAEVARLSKLGATVADRHEDEGFHVVMLDVEGNEFCVA
jgi:hypothetical protein